MKAKVKKTREAITALQLKWPTVGHYNSRRLHKEALETRLKSFLIRKTYDRLKLLDFIILCDVVVY